MQFAMFITDTYFMVKAVFGMLEVPKKSKEASEAKN